MGMGWVVKMRLADSRFSNYLIVTCDDGVQNSGERGAERPATSEFGIALRFEFAKNLRFELS